MKKSTNYIVLFLMSYIFLIGCTEEIDFKIDNYESVLVVDALITNEFKYQEIKLSKTYRFDEDIPIPEKNASITILSSQGEEVFEEIENGKYMSINPFKAEPNIEYVLSITTQNGNKYNSSTQVLPNTSTIDQLYAIRETNDLGESGMGIYVDSYDPTNSSKFYRYEYEETYKIIAPSWVPEEIIVLEQFFPCTVDLVYRENEEQICYNTVYSNNINITSTNSFVEDRVNKHLVRFIKDDNYIISHRYSILLKQYVTSSEVFNYYETLKSFSEEGSIFSQVQTGYINSNVSSDSNPNEKVLGYFEVSSINTQRIYFNYEDFYPNEEIPPFPINCIPTVHDQFTMSGNCGPLITETLSDRIIYHHGASKILDTLTPQKDDYITIGPFFMVLKPCGDCTTLGENVVPEFWEE